ncbi:hypothetical protein QFC20_007207 [Naganishia adeliensis]|uniref:Uncharacterized protein n=1 Tax=Naganishia adeliensis TaxID=92952 RepID=A0ACC2V1A3_9TREE|nr:hypothetical protein QFC20_007207 [Naganishia adeliensis]
MSVASQQKRNVEWFEGELACLLKTPPDGEPQQERSKLLAPLRSWAMDAKRRSTQYGFVHSCDKDCAKALGVQLAWKATWNQNNKVHSDTALGELWMELTNPPHFRGFLGYVQEGYRAYLETELQKPRAGQNAGKVALEYASKFSVLDMTDEMEASVDGTQLLAETSSLASFASGQTLPAEKFFSLILGIQETA